MSMEDDDTAVDILTSAINNTTKENEDSHDEAALICLGDNYCGHKKVTYKHIII